MPLSDFLDNPRRIVGDRITGDPLGTPQLFYRYSGKRFEGKPAKVVFSDPIRYYDQDGMDLVPQERLNPDEYKDVETWDTYTIPLEEIKNYLKVDHNLEDKLIEMMTAAAISKAAQRINRTFQEVPADVELAIYKTILFWYENRSDTNNAPADAEAVFETYYRWPGV